MSLGTPDERAFIPAAEVESQPGKVFPCSLSLEHTDKGIEGGYGLGIFFRCRGWPLVVRCPQKTVNPSSAPD